MRNIFGPNKNEASTQSKIRHVENFRNSNSKSYAVFSTGGTLAFQITRKNYGVGEQN
jgi:hypothetical protein